MKKLFVLFAFMLTGVYANAQLMRAEELEKYAENLYGKKWVDVAENLKNESTLTLDKNNSLTFISHPAFSGLPQAALRVCAPASARCGHAPSSALS